MSNSNSNKNSSGSKSLSTLKSFSRKFFNSKSFDDSISKNNAKNIDPSSSTKKLLKKNTSPLPSSSKKLGNIINHRHSPSNTNTQLKPTNPFRNNKGSTSNGSSTFTSNNVSNSNSNSNTPNTISHMSSFPDKPMIYNPYGIQSHHDNSHDASFYLHDGSKKIRVLPLPIENPNDFLPEEMKQKSVHLLDNFKFDVDHKIIGNGCTSEVKKIVSSFNSNQIYAFKKLNMIYEENKDNYYTRCTREFVIARYLNEQANNNPDNKFGIHIIGIFDLCKVPTTTFMARGWGYVMELGKFDLFSLITKSGWKNVDVNEKYCIFKQICDGVKFMHDNGIAHRDLKPENVLLCQNGICKITDFGISNWYHEEPKNFDSPIKLCKGMIGSPPYASPEVMMWDPKKKYPQSLQLPFDPLALDCYSLGIILITLINNMIPFLESSNKDSKFRDYQSGYENFITYNNKNFRDKKSYKAGPGIEYNFAKFFKNTDAARVAWRLADPNVGTRYTMDDLFDDPWFNSIETCIDFNHLEDYMCKEPKIKNSTLENLFENDDLTDSSRNPSITNTIRSMVDIANDPKTEIESTSNDTVESSSSSKPITSPPSSSSVSSKAGLKKDENLFTVNEIEEIRSTNDEEDKHNINSVGVVDIRLDNELEIELQKTDNQSCTVQQEHIIKNNNGIKQLHNRGNISVKRTQISMNTTRTSRKKIVHNHLNVNNSRTNNMNGSSNFHFGDSSLSSTSLYHSPSSLISSSVGSSSYSTRPVVK